MIPYRIAAIGLLIGSLILVGCAQPRTDDTDTTSSPPADEELFGQTPEEAIADFVDELEGEGAAVTSTELQGETLFGTTKAYGLTVNDERIIAFAFDAGDAADEAAANIAPDGLSIEGQPVQLVNPHYFHEGNIIAIYDGMNATVLELLESTLGNQIAGAEVTGTGSIMESGTGDDAGVMDDGTVTY